ncbi:MAG: hypothetical protein M3Y56_17030, partial [Armatimonadota bacterium]|nr:hypothetical protein [Armatimonadota bacterium]
MFLPLLSLLIAAPTPLPQCVWLEAETFGPLQGSNFSFMAPEAETRGSWSLAGPDTAPSWTQGGESEFMSIAARADEPGELVISHDIEVPAAGDYTLWVRYADYRLKQESFGVRVIQGADRWNHVFGLEEIVDEMDPMKLLWDWSFAWDHAAISLYKGPAHFELYTTGPTGARRAVDCLCFTTDAAYHPTGREKPDAAAWLPLRAAQQPTAPPVEPLVAPQWSAATPPAWKISPDKPTFLWNTRQQWLDEIKKPTVHIEAPFNVDPPLLKDFGALYDGKAPPVYGHPLSSPAWYIPSYPEAFTTGSPFLQWLDRHPDKKFAFLLNYAEPSWPAGADRAAVHANLLKYNNRFVGFVAGESISYDAVDNTALEARVRAAKTRGDVLAALRDLHTAATEAKFAGYYGAPVTPAEAWAPVIS